MYFNYVFSSTKDYLTEDNLEIFLKDFIKDCEMVRDKKCRVPLLKIGLTLELRN